MFVYTDTWEEFYVCFTIDWSVFGRDCSHLILRGGMGIERVNCVWKLYSYDFCAGKWEGHVSSIDSFYPQDWIWMAFSGKQRVCNLWEKIQRMKPTDSEQRKSGGTFWDSFNFHILKLPFKCCNVLWDDNVMKCQ